MDLNFEKQPATKEKSKGGLLAVGLTGGVAIGLSIICYPFVSPALRRVCLPFVPATDTQISNIIQALRGRSGNLLDIGSGDGRIVFAAAKKGFKADGVELNPWLVYYSKFASFKNGTSKSTNFYRRDLWKFPIKQYKNVVIFGVKEMMEDLELKFDKELDDSFVAACRFPLPNKEPIQIIDTGIDTVWVYHFNKKS